MLRRKAIVMIFANAVWEKDEGARVTSPLRFHSAKTGREMKARAEGGNLLHFLRPAAEEHSARAPLRTFSRALRCRRTRGTDPTSILSAAVAVVTGEGGFLGDATHRHRWVILRDNVII